MKTLSGGQKRRLDLGLALVGDPELVFLDEPTTGFDPSARRAAWEMIRSLRALGKTVLLTTHYLDEAEQLADRVAVLREGQIATVGTPRDLTSAAATTEIRYRRNGDDVVLRTDDPTRVLHELTERALADGVELERLEVRRPTLEDVYLELVGIDGGRRMSVFAHQLRSEQLIFWRSREAAIFIFVFPLLLFTLLGAVYANGTTAGVKDSLWLLAGDGRLRLREHRLRRDRDLRRDPARELDPEAPALDAAARARLPARAAGLDDARLRARDGAPVPARARAFGTPFPTEIFSLALAVLLGGAAFAALGVAAAALIRSAEGSSAAINVILLPMAFLSGSSVRPGTTPGFLQAIADVLPLKYFIDIVDGIYIRGHQIWHYPEAVAVVAAWGLGGLLVAVRAVPLGTGRGLGRGVEWAFEVHAARFRTRILPPPSGRRAASSCS